MAENVNDISEYKYFVTPIKAFIVGLFTAIIMIIPVSISLFFISSAVCKIYGIILLVLLTIFSFFLYGYFAKLFWNWK